MKQYTSLVFDRGAEDMLAVFDLMDAAAGPFSVLIDGEQWTIYHRAPGSVGPIECMVLACHWNLRHWLEDPRVAA